MTTFISICIHDVIDEVTRSPGWSIFKIDGSSSIFQLERRSKLNISEMLMAILLVYSASSITYVKKICRYLKTAAILKKKMKYHTQFQFDLRYQNTVPNYAKMYFYGDDVTGWPQIWSIYLCLGAVGSGSKLQGQCLVNKCEYRNRLSRLYMPKEDLNK